VRHTSAAAGPHFQNVLDPVVPSVDPAYANPTNEIWLDLTTNAAGHGIAQTKVPWQFSSTRRAESVIIHQEHTHTGPTDSGVAGERLACLDVRFSARAEESGGTSRPGERLDRGDDAAVVVLGADAPAQIGGRRRVAAVVQHFGDGVGDASWLRPGVESSTDVVRDDPGGVVGLVATQGKDQAGPPGCERLDDGAVSAMGDDEVYVRQDPCMGYGGNDADAGSWRRLG